VEQARVQAALAEELQASEGEAGNIKILDSLGLEGVTDPFFNGRSASYELIR
jgi:hypothetical protein